MTKTIQNKTVFFEKGSNFFTVNGERFVLEQDAEATIFGTTQARLLPEKNSEKKNNDKRRRIIEIYRDSF